MARLLGALCLLFITTACGPQAQPDPIPGAEFLPLYANPDTRPAILAYYYIWFDPTSWNRAKTDYPWLGNYSSYDRSSMRQHIRWARAAGIEGFIVSWKGSDKLNERLASLAEIAVQEEFQLVLLYQGLDFEREPISVDKIAADLDYFVEHYLEHLAFALYEQPLVIWAGTWGYSRAEVAEITQTRREQLIILASERNGDGYERLADLVDGNAYYWAALNPNTYPNYPGKLIEMGQQVHAHNGIWIAPAAPGFDARMVGGKSIVERAHGDLFKRQLSGAIQSAPDALGIISWNEFSENSHIEPSDAYGMYYLAVLGSVLGVNLDELHAGYEQIERRPPVSIGYALPTLFTLTGVVGVALFVAARRRRADAFPPRLGSSAPPLEQ